MGRLGPLSAQLSFTGCVFFLIGNLRVRSSWSPFHVLHGERSIALYTERTGLRAKSGGPARNADTAGLYRFVVSTIVLSPRATAGDRAASGFACQHDAISTARRRVGCGRSLKDRVATHKQRKTTE